MKKGRKPKPKPPRKKEGYKGIEPRIDESILEPMEVSPEIEPLWRNPLIKLDDDKVLTIDDLVYAIRVAHGIPIFAARFLGLSRSKFLYYVKHNRRLAQVAKNERESIIDLAEGRLFEALSEGYAWAVRYVLDTLGKDRGYTTEIRKPEREGELLKAIENITVMDTEELIAYDEEQKKYCYDKRTGDEIIKLRV